jgi:hypothetical protein
VLLLAAHGLLAATHYVASGSPTPLAPYTNWDTATSVIQQAVDAALPGDIVLVSNGVYSAGGRAAGTNQLVNRVAVTNRVWVSSVNGPQFTSIVGHQLHGVTNGTGAVRCVYLASGAGLSGFTLTRGATLTNGYGYDLEEGGGAVYCDSTSAVVTNCVLAGNSAFFHGGGAYGGTLISCILSNNWADSGGGAAFGLLYNCLLTGNTAGGVDGFGGGARRATLNNCTLAGNTAWSGGGASGHPDNWACVLNNCIICFNSAYYGQNYDACTLNDCWTSDPLFVDYPGGNLRLQPNSPCINAGDNAFVTSTTDLDGNPRIVRGTVDIGAYEFQSPGLVSAAPAGANVAISWQSVGGMKYFLERTMSLGSPFTVVATNLIGQGVTTTFTDTNAAGLSPLFYRVGVQGP